MTKLINKIRKELTNYTFETKGWTFVLVLMLILIVLSSCSTLKYDPDYKRDMMEFEDHYKFCDQWVTVSSEAWMTCMMDRRTTVVPVVEISPTTGGQTSTSTLTYHPITIWSSVGT